MRKLLNTLYVTSSDSYLALDGENIVVFDKEQEIGRLPLHNLEGIVSFGYRGTSPALMGACAQRNICNYSAMRLRRTKTRRKLACREVLSSSDIGRLARIEDLAAYAALSSVSCANPRCMAE